MTTSHATEFEQVIRAGGIALFPSDTVYGLACDPDNELAIKRLYAIKRRPAEKPSARMFFDLATALGQLPELVERAQPGTVLGPKIQAALIKLLPGPATLVLPSGVGLRVVEVPQLSGATVAVLQSSANLSGEADPHTLQAVNKAIREAADLQIDGGKLPGIPSTVIDLRAYEHSGDWRILRQGALPETQIAQVLGA